MFEEYLQDAHNFLEIALESQEEKIAKRYYRASVICLSSAIESFLNYVATSFDLAESIDKFEVAYINDKKIVFDSRKLSAVERTEFHPIDEKIKLLLKRFSDESSLTENPYWSRFKEFKKFRDSLIHPRVEEDETSIEDYKHIVKEGMSSTIEVMSSLSKAIYRKPLRQKILDLIPD
jgi:hypothetical protein